MSPPPGGRPEISPPTGASPPAVFTAFLAGVTVLAVAFPAPWGWPWPLQAVGVGLVAAGWLLHTWAWRHFRRAGTTVATLAEPRTLVVDGPYARSRNPMYLAGVLIVLGWALAMRTPWGVALAGAFGVVAYTCWIRAEESLLDRCGGEGWRRYRSQVRRWL